MVSRLAISNGRAYIVSHCSPIHSITALVYKPPTISLRRPLSKSVLKQSKVDTPEHERQWVNPMATWLAVANPEIDQAQILRQLPKILERGPNTYDRAHKRAIFFVTPKLARLLEPNSPFYADAINTIFANSRDGLADHVKAESVAVIVDALPWQRIAIQKDSRPWRRQTSGYEGLAVVLVGLAPHDLIVSHNEEDALLEFVQTQAGHRTLYQLAPANTLFVNGNKHTMTLDTWESEKGAKFGLVGHEKLSRIQIPIMIRHGQDRTPSMHTGLESITKPAIIAASMGNIIREIFKQDDQTTVSASHELEQLVPPMVEKKDQTQAGLELRVFALVCPPWAKQPYRMGDNPAKHLLTIFRHGGRLHRVTSGGGGWGKKAGLLSLEPVTDLSFNAENEDIMPSFLQSYDETMPLPGDSDVCPPGHSVQFFASWHDPEVGQFSAQDGKDAEFAYRWRTTDYHDPEKNQAISFGTTIIPDKLEYSAESYPDRRRESMVFEPNTFGCLTTGSLGIRTPRLDNVKPAVDNLEPWTTYSKSQDRALNHGTLVDVPNTRVSVTQLAGKGSRKWQLMLSQDQETDNTDRDTNHIAQSTALPTSMSESDEKKQASPDRPLIRTTTTLKPEIRKIDHDSPRMSANYVAAAEAQAQDWNDEFLRKKHDFHIRAGRGHSNKSVSSNSSLFASKHKTAQREAMVVDGLVADLEKDLSDEEHSKDSTK